MIKTDAQRERTVVQIDGFRRALAKSAEKTMGERATAIRSSYEGMIRQLEAEVREYDELKTGRFALPSIERRDQIGPFVVKLRIAQGVSCTPHASRTHALR